MRFLFRLIVVLLMISFVGAAAIGYIVSRGFSARAEPSKMEETVALRLRSLATPTDAKSARNPVPANAANVRAGLEHFADHCAVCHGNDGSGEGSLGGVLYPRPPDLRAARTQSLTDGEIFYIIENGVRFTGMPAFGGDHGGEEDSWKLVHFIRHLPKITAEELGTMKKLNPMPPAEREDEQRMNKFLEGGSPAPHTHKKTGK